MRAAGVPLTASVGVAVTRSHDASALLARADRAMYLATSGGRNRVGVAPDAARVVCAGRVITAGGVPAGIDVALTLMTHLAGELCAQAVELGIECAPAPPLRWGRPALADESVVAAARQRLQALRPGTGLRRPDAAQALRQAA